MNNNRFATVLIGVFISLCAFGQPSGKYAAIVDVKTYVDEHFNVYYSLCIRNKTNKDITSVKYEIGFRDPYKPFNIVEAEFREVTTQVLIPRGEKKFTEYEMVIPKHGQYVMYIASINAIRFSDGTMIQARFDGDFGHYWPD